MIACKEETEKCEIEECNNNELDLKTSNKSDLFLARRENNVRRNNHLRYKQLYLLSKNKRNTLLINVEDWWGMILLRWYDNATRDELLEEDPTLK